MEWLNTKSPRLILTGGAHLLIENHTCIRAFAPERIEIDTCDGALFISGANLAIRAAADCALHVAGEIKLIEIGGDAQCP